jgi:hypothetical protein
MYQGRNKQQWATLQSKIRQRLATQNILYLENESEMIRRTTPPAPAVTLHASVNRIESATDKDDRIRMQKLRSMTMISRRETENSTSIATNWPLTTRRQRQPTTTTSQDISSPISTDG